jgi:hypothetical protein
VDAVRLFGVLESMSVHVVAFGSLQRRLTRLNANSLEHYESRGGYPFGGFGLLFSRKKAGLGGVAGGRVVLNLTKVVSD